MDDLIRRQAAIDALNKMKIYRPLDSDRYVISDCLNKIVNLPSAQPERKTGRWLRTEAYPHRIYCSSCFVTFIRNDEFLNLNDIPHGFCPHCGADMRGDGDG